MSDQLPYFQKKEPKVLGSARSNGLLVQIFQISCRFLTGFCKRSCRKIKSYKFARDTAGNLKIVKSRNKLNEFNLKCTLGGGTFLAKILN